MRGAVADFVKFRVEHPTWTCTRSPDMRGFIARIGGREVRAATLGELAQRIEEAERHPQG